MRLLTTASLTLLTSMAALPSPALAVSGLYAQIGLGYGKFSGTSLITEELAADGDLPLMGEGCCPDGGLAGQFRLGYSLFGVVGGEFGIFGNGWDLGSDTGGAGFVGGGIRAYPLGIMALAGLESDLPIDIGVGALFGYAIIGKEFAYSGTFIDIDFHIEYILTTFMSVGAKIDFVIPQYSDFVFTDYKNNLGRCLDDSGAHVVPADNSRLNKESATCNGSGPSTTLISPQLVFTFHFDVFE